MDADSKRVLYSENMNERKLIASTTKIMTSIVALENANFYDRYKVGNEIDEVYGSMIYVKKDESIYLEDLLYGLMLRSGNDAANIIATNVLGYEKFIKEMNNKAIKLKMNNTTFENPHGLDEKTKNYSTSYDLSLLMVYAIKNKDFIKITNTKKYKTKTDKDEYIWYNKNKLLSDYKYAISGKIGYTDSSGQVFVSYAKKDNKRLVIASIDEADKFNLHRKLYEKYFNEYDKYKIIDSYSFSLKDDNYKDSYLYIKNDINMLLNDKDKINVNIKLNKKLNNKVAGYLNINIDNKEVYKEKIYSIKYKDKISKIKKILLFWKN